MTDQDSTDKRNPRPSWGYLLVAGCVAIALIPVWFGETAILLHRIAPYINPIANYDIPLITKFAMYLGLHLLMIVTLMLTMCSVPYITNKILGLDKRTTT